uniref:Uncharacterized protein n=1 Tax=Alexandrium andersonii TaxID=327968 RepID=A0A7S2MVR7_9DINO
MGHVVTQRGIAPKAEVYCGTGSVAHLGHSMILDSHVFANSGSFVSLSMTQLLGSAPKVYAQCNSGSLVRVAGAAHLDRTETMGCKIFQPGEKAWDDWCSYSAVTGQHDTVACALMPIPPAPLGQLRMSGLLAPLGAIQWVETGGTSDPSSPEFARAIELLVFKNAELYPQVHNVIKRYPRQWEQQVLRQQLAVSELVSGAAP